MSPPTGELVLVCHVEPSAPSAPAAPVGPVGPVANVPSPLKNFTWSPAIGAGTSPPAPPVEPVAPLTSGMAEVYWTLGLFLMNASAVSSVTFQSDWTFTSPTPEMVPSPCHTAFPFESIVSTRLTKLVVAPVIALTAACCVVDPVPPPPIGTTVAWSSAVV